MSKNFCNQQEIPEKTSPGTKNYLFPNGIIVGIGGPSAVGKSTIIDRLSQTCNAAQAYSVTTRPLRGPEDKRKPVTIEEYQRMLDSKELIEGVIYEGHGYGISRTAVSEILSRGQIAILDCNQAGMEQLLQTDLAPTVVTIFLVCSAEEVLRRQLARAAGTRESQLSRLYSSLQEIEGARSSGIFQFVVRNDNVDAAVTKIIRIIEGKNGESDYFNVDAFKQDMTALLERL